MRLHANQYGSLSTSNSVTNTLIKPRIDITAIGQSSPQIAIIPTASSTTLGGVKVDGSTITISDGVISSSGGGGGSYTLPVAGSSTLGGIKVGTGLSIDSSTGVLSAGTASSSTLDGQILETLAGVCDGRTVTVESGSYLLTNVHSTQNTTTSWADVTGSSISYTPPSGTKQVIFEFHLSLSTDTDYGGDSRYDGRAIILFKMLIDGTAVTSQNQEWGDNNYSWGDNFFIEV